MFKALCAILCVFTILDLQAREYRGGHKTQVWCTTSGLASAKDCMRRVAEAMPTENDANAAFVTRSQKAKKQLKALLKAQGNEQDIRLVDKADYIGIVVQNDDEESVYYYALSKGKGIPRLLGDTVSIVDLGYDICRGRSDYPASFGKVSGILLGLNENNSIVGVVWFEDTEC